MLKLQVMECPLAVLNDVLWLHNDLDNYKTNFR